MSQIAINQTSLHANLVSFSKGWGVSSYWREDECSTGNSLKFTIKDTKLDHALKYYADMYLLNSAQHTVCRGTTGDLTMQTMMRLRASFSQNLMAVKRRNVVSIKNLLQKFKKTNRNPSLQGNTALTFTYLLILSIHGLNTKVWYKSSLG